MECSPVQWAVLSAKCFAQMPFACSSSSATISGFYVPGVVTCLGGPGGLALPLVRHGRRLVHGAGCGARRLRAGCDGGGSSGGDARHRPGAGPGPGRAGPG